MGIDAFSLDFASSETLASQLADNISQAIAGGDFKPGDKLPSIAQMAERCKTSVRVPREAVRILENEGVVKGRPRSGLIVLDKKRFVWRGSVLFVSYGRQSYYYRGVLFKNIAQRLSEEGWRVDFVNLSCGEDGTHKRLEPLRRALQNGHRLVFGAHLDAPTLEEIRKASIPYFSISGSGGVGDESVVIHVSLSETEAIVGLAQTSARRGIRNVLRVAMDDADELFALPFASLGIKTENMVVCPDASINRFENSSQTVYKRVIARLTDRRKPKPDLVYFADDSFTSAGLWALERVGWRIPEDIRVVTQSNRGNRPFYPIPVACVEHDLVEDSARIAKGMLAFLEGRKFSRLIICAAHFHSGETF